MPFWSDPQAEPKRAYRWLMFINDLPQWIIKRVDKPNFSITESVHTYINHNFYYPGKVEYEPIRVTLVDPVTPDAAERMMRFLSDTGYAFPDDPFDTSTISKAGAVTALGNVEIQQLGARSEVVERITLENAWIKSVNFGDLDYTSDDLVNIELEMRYDFFTMETIQPSFLSGLATAVGL